MITFEDFKKIEIKIGQILFAEKVPETDKLLKLIVDFGEKDNEAESRSLPPEGNATSAAGRQIISGISAYFPDEKMLVGKKCAFVTNLEPRTIRGLQSNGMILAVSGERGAQNFFSLLETNEDVVPGSSVK
jgi:tRNA-binding EMAP/Myf-like protein